MNTNTLKVDPAVTSILGMEEVMRSRAQRVVEHRALVEWRLEEYPAYLASLARLVTPWTWHGFASPSANTIKKKKKKKSLRNSGRKIAASCVS